MSEPVQPSAAPALDVERKWREFLSVGGFVNTGMTASVNEDALRTLIFETLAEVASLKAELLDRENIEAACCPEDVGFEEYIAHLLAENRELHTLAKIGTWHNDCRMNRKQAARELEKSQAIINKLADRITELEAEVARLRALQESKT